MHRSYPAHQYSNQKASILHREANAVEICQKNGTPAQPSPLPNPLPEKVRYLCFIIKKRSRQKVFFCYCILSVSAKITKFPVQKLSPILSFFIRGVGVGDVYLTLLVVAAEDIDCHRTSGLNFKKGPLTSNS